MAVSDFALGSKEYTSEQRIPSTSYDEQLLQQLASFYGTRISAGLPPVLSKDPIGDLGLLLKVGVGRELAFANTSIEQLRRQYSQVNFDPKFVGGILLPYIPDVSIFNQNLTDRELWSLAKTVVQHFLEGSSERNVEDLVFSLTGTNVDIVYDSESLNSFSIDLEMASSGIQEVYQRLSQISKIVELLKPAHFIFNPRIRFSESFYQGREILPDIVYGLKSIKPTLYTSPNLVQYSDTQFFTSAPSNIEVQYGDISLVLDTRGWNGSPTEYSVFILQEADISETEGLLGDVSDTSSIVEDSVLDAVKLTIRGTYTWEENGVVQSGLALFLLDALTEIRDQGKRIPTKKIGSILGASADRLIIKKASKLEVRPNLRPSTAVSLTNSWLDSLPNQVLRYDTLPNSALGSGDILFNRRYDLVSYQSMSSSSPYVEAFASRDRGFYQSNGIYLPISFLKADEEPVKVYPSSGNGTIVDLGGYTPILKNQPLLTIVHSDENITLSKFVMLSDSYNTLKPTIVSLGYLDNSLYPEDLSVVIEIDLNQEYPAGLSADLIPGTNILKKQFTRLNLEQNKLVPFSSKYRGLRQNSKVILSKSPRGSSSDFFYEGVAGTFGLVFKAVILEETAFSGILSVIDEENVISDFYLKTRHNGNGFYVYSELPTPSGAVIEFSGDFTSKKAITDYEKPIVVSRYQEDARKNWTSKESRLYHLKKEVALREVLFEVSGDSLSVCDQKGFTAIAINPDLTVDLQLDIESGLKVFVDTANPSISYDSKVQAGSNYLPVFKDLVSGELASNSYDLILKLMGGSGSKAFYQKDLATGSYSITFPGAAPVISESTYAEVVGIRLKPIYVGTVLQNTDGSEINIEVLSKSLQASNREISTSNNEFFGLGQSLYSTVQFSDEDLVFNPTSYSSYSVGSLNYLNKNLVKVKNAPILNGSSGFLQLSDFDTIRLESVGQEGPYDLPLGTMIDPESGEIRLPFFPPFTEVPTSSIKSVKSSVSISSFVSIEGSEFSFALDGQARLDSDGVSTSVSYILDEEEDPGVPLINSARFPKIISRKFRAFENNRTTLLDSSDTLSLDKSGNVSQFSVVYSTETSKTVNPEQEFYNQGIKALSSERAGIVPFFISDCSKPVSRKDQNFVDVGPSAEDNGYTLFTSVEFRDPAYSGNVLSRDSVDLSNKGRYLQYGDVDSTDWENTNRQDVLHTLSSIEVQSSEEGEDIRLTSLHESSKGMEMFLVLEEDYYPDREFRVNNYKDYFKEIGREVFLRAKMTLVSGSADINLAEDLDYSGYSVEVREIGGEGVQSFTIKGGKLSRAFKSFSGKLVEKVFVEVFNPVIVDPYLECTLTEYLSTRLVGINYEDSEISTGMPSEEIPLTGQVKATSSIPMIGVGDYQPVGFTEQLCFISSHELSTTDETFKSNLRSLTDLYVTSTESYTKASYYSLAASCQVSGNTVVYLLESSQVATVLNQSIDFVQSRELAEFICKPAGEDPFKDLAKSSFNLLIAVKTENPVTNPTGIVQVRTIRNISPTLLNKSVWGGSEVRQIDLRVYTGEYIKYENLASGKFSGIEVLGPYGWGGSRLAVKASYLQDLIIEITGAPFSSLSSNLGKLDESLLIEISGQVFKVTKALMVTTDGYLIVELSKGLDTNKRNIPAKFFAVKGYKAGIALPASLIKDGSSLHTKDYVVSVNGLNSESFLKFKSVPISAGIRPVSRDASVISSVSNTRGVNLNSVFRKFFVEDVTVGPTSIPGMASVVLEVTSLGSCYNWTGSFGKNQVRIPFPAVMLEEGDMITIGKETRWITSYAISGSDLILTLNDDVKYVSAAGSLTAVPSGFCTIKRVHVNSVVDNKFTHIKVGEEFFPLTFKSDAISGGVVISGEGMEKLLGSISVRLTKVFTGYFPDPSNSPYSVQGPRSWDGSGPVYKKDRDGNILEIPLSQTAVINGSGSLVVTPSSPYTVRFLDNPGETTDLSNTNPLIYPYFIPMGPADKASAALKLGLTVSEYETYLENPARYFYKLVKWRNWDQMAVTPIGNYSDSTPWVVALRSWAKFI